MIKVQVPKLSTEDVERVRRSMESITAALRAMAPIVTTLALQIAQQGAILGRTFRQQVEYEARKREAQAAGYPCEGAEYGVCPGPKHTVDCPSYVPSGAEVEDPRGRD